MLEGETSAELPVISIPADIIEPPAGRPPAMMYADDSHSEIASSRTGSETSDSEIDEIANLSTSFTPHLFT